MKLGKRFRTRVTVILAIVLAMTASPLATSASPTHIISPGETLYSIALRYGVDLEEIARLNDIADPNVIYAGAQLHIPTTGGQSVTATVHLVAPGETLYSIAARYGTSVQAILALNDMISDPNMIFPGQTLLVSGSDSGAGGSPGLAAPAAGLTRAEIESLLEYYANLYGLSPSLVKAIAWQESGWQQHVISSSGAIGVMQVMPATGGWVASAIVGRPLDLHNVNDNILAGVAYLDWLIRYTGNLEIAVASYYQGPGSMSRNGMFADTRHYLSSVFAIQQHILTHGAPPYP